MAAPTSTRLFEELQLLLGQPLDGPPQSPPVPSSHSYPSILSRLATSLPPHSSPDSSTSSLSVYSDHPSSRALPSSLIRPRSPPSISLLPNSLTLSPLPHPSPAPPSSPPSPNGARSDAAFDHSALLAPSSSASSPPRISPSPPPCSSPPSPPPCSSPPSPCPPRPLPPPSHPSQPGTSLSSPTKLAPSSPDLACVPSPHHPPSPPSLPLPDFFPTPLLPRRTSLAPCTTSAHPKTPRSPLANRSSSDCSFLEQWRWLESHPPPSLSPGPPPNPILASPHPIRALDSHFSPFLSSPASHTHHIQPKFDILTRRQATIAHWHKLWCPFGNRSSLKDLRPTLGDSWLNSVPTLDHKDLKHLPSSLDRAKAYQTTLSQLAKYDSGLDLWLWSKTCLEKSDHQSTSPQPPSNLVRKNTADSVPPRHKTHYQLRLTPSPGHQLKPSQSAPSHPKYPPILSSRSSHSRLRNSSGSSSLVSFPTRGDGQRAIQLNAKAEDELLELISPSKGPPNDKKPMRMMVNKLMEVNNLPFPGLYPHSSIHHSSPPPPPPPPPQPTVSSSAPPPTRNSISTTSNSDNRKPDLSSFTMNHGLIKRRASQEPASHHLGLTKSGGGFFSQIGKRSSSLKPRQSSLDNGTLAPTWWTNSSTNSISSHILPSTLSGPVPHRVHEVGGGPRGPRPDIRKSDIGLPMSQREHEAILGSAPPNESQLHQRMSWASGTWPNPHPRSQQHHHTSHLPLVAPESRPLADVSEVDSHSSLGTSPDGAAPGWNLPIFTHTHQRTVAKDALTPSNPRGVGGQRCDPPGHHSPRDTTAVGLPPPPETTPNPLLTQKVQKMLDILPGADTRLLAKALMREQLDEVAAIGCYLSMKQQQQ